MSSHCFDAVIAGAGIIGVACALECVRAGLRTALVEAGTIAGGATGAAMGHIVLMDDSEAEWALTRYGRLLWEELAPQLSPRCEYRRAGTIWVASDEASAHAARAKCASFTARGERAEWLNELALRELEPNLRNELPGGLLVPDDSIVDPVRAALELCARAQAQGLQVFTGMQAVSLDDRGLRLADGSSFGAPFLVNAAGARSPRLTPALPVRGRKGHVLRLEAQAGYRHQIVELGYLQSAHDLTADSVAFNIQPRSAGRLLVGSSRQYSDEQHTVDGPLLAAMLARALGFVSRPEFVSGLSRHAPDQVVTGLRAATPDKLPFIGRVPGQTRVFAATGHEGLGITSSLATARLLVDELLDRPSDIDRRPYSPARLHCP